MGVDSTFLEFVIKNFQIISEICLFVSMAYARELLLIIIICLFIKYLIQRDLKFWSSALSNHIPLVYMHNFIHHASEVPMQRFRLNREVSVKSPQIITVFFNFYKNNGINYSIQFTHRLKK